jgi:hypothetical protein
MQSPVDGGNTEEIGQYAVTTTLPEDHEPVNMMRS